MTDHAGRPRQSELDMQILAHGQATIERSRRLLDATQHLTDAHRLNPRIAQNSVSIVDGVDEWRVLVAEAGVGILTRLFRDRISAFNFAEGQMMRLGLDKVTRI